MADIGNEQSLDKNLTIEFPSAVKVEKTFEQLVEEEEDFKFSDIGSTHAANKKLDSNSVDSVDEMDKPIFSENEMKSIVEYSHQVIRNRKSVLPTEIKQEHTYTPPVVLKTEKEQSYLPQIQASIPVEGRIILVSKKDYCNVTAEQSKLFSALHLSLSGKNNYEKLDKLYNGLADIGLISLIKQQRVRPVPNETSPLGYTSAKIIYRLAPSAADMERNQFLDQTGDFDAKTWTHLIALREDDLACYDSDVICLKKIMTASFDSQMMLFVQPLMLAGKVLEAFHALITRVRGTKQVDIKKARQDLNAFVQFDMTVELPLGMNELTRLMSDLAFATGKPLTEDELKTKFHEIVFNDERLSMHTCLLDSITKELTFQESVDTMFRVMELLPPDKQKLSTTIASFNNMDKKMSGAVNYCFDFQHGNCTRKKCRYVHEINSEVKSATKDRKNTTSNDKGKLEAKETKTTKDTEKKNFHVALSQRDRSFIGPPRGKVFERNFA